MWIEAKAILNFPQFYRVQSQGAHVSSVWKMFQKFLHLVGKMNSFSENCCLKPWPNSKSDHHAWLHLRQNHHTLISKNTISYWQLPIISKFNFPNYNRRLEAFIRLNSIIHVHGLKYFILTIFPEYKQKYNNSKSLHGILYIFWLLLKYLVQNHFRHRHQKDHNCEKIVEKKQQNSRTRATNFRYFYIHFIHILCGWYASCISLKTIQKLLT